MGILAVCFPQGALYAGAQHSGQYPNVKTIAATAVTPVTSHLLYRSSVLRISPEHSEYSHTVSATSRQKRVYTVYSCRLRRRQAQDSGGKQGMDVVSRGLSRHRWQPEKEASPPLLRSPLITVIMLQE